MNRMKCLEILLASLVVQIPLSASADRVICTVFESFVDVAWLCCCAGHPMGQFPWAQSHTTITGIVVVVVIPIIIIFIEAD